ncbi:hypothetical protein RCH06_003581 [Polaromonas sp. CG_9.5]|uniref:hypothetical protein n=1 Tax=Polaromonas sp. CG_9.5 TaxID=3071705 RepID=UPI002DFC90FA|nr:hypothetical protein [Polaromonas sp. CG_9.5]
MFNKSSIKFIPFTLAVTAALMMGGMAQAQTGAANGASSSPMTGSGVKGSPDASGPGAGMGSKGDMGTTKGMNSSGAKSPMTGSGVQGSADASGSGAGMNGSKKAMHTKKAKKHSRAKTGKAMGGMSDHSGSATDMAKSKKAAGTSKSMNSTSGNGSPMTGSGVKGSPDASGPGAGKTQ